MPLRSVPSTSCTQNLDKLEQGAKALLEKETLTADELPKPQVEPNVAELTPVAGDERAGGKRGQGAVERQVVPHVVP